MGAKMMPMEKKRGRTVFGVRIGLVCGQRRGFAPWEVRSSSTTYCHAFSRCCRKAVSIG